MESLDLFNNKLGGSPVGHNKSVLTIGSWAVIGYYNASIGSNDSDGFLVRLYPSEYTWGLPNLNELNLFGNGIYYEYGGGDMCGGATSIAVRIRNGIPSSTQISSLTKHDRLNKTAYIKSKSDIIFE